jgi:hypothetical protein
VTKLKYFRGQKNCFFSARKGCATDFWILILFGTFEKWGGGLKTLRRHCWEIVNTCVEKTIISSVDLLAKNNTRYRKINKTKIKI